MCERRSKSRIALNSFRACSPRRLPRPFIFRSIAKNSINCWTVKSTPLVGRNPPVPENESIIRVNGVRKSFGKHEVLKGLDLQVPAGCIFGLLGVNGQGKTTL